MKNNLVQTFFTKKSDGKMNNIKNRKNFLVSKNLADKKDITMNPVHSNKIVIVTENYQPTECDGLITDKNDVALFVHVADCLPILFFDPIQRVIAVAHAGRLGTFKNISAEMIRVFKKKFNSRSSDILVEIGPGANVCCYEVGNENNEIIKYVLKNFGKEFVKGKNIDIRVVNKKQLIDLGILEKNIIHKNICTMCGNEEYFSYRNGNLKERFAGVIALN